MKVSYVKIFFGIILKKGTINNGKKKVNCP